LKALRARRNIELSQEPSPIEAVPPKSTHLVVCEAGEELSEVMAANYAFALGAGLCIIPQVDKSKSEEVLALRAEDITIAEALKPLGYATGQFGKNHLGDRNEFLPTVHGFDEFFGNLYHLNAEEEPENPDYPKDPRFKARYGPRGVLKCVATAEDDPIADPRFGRVGRQSRALAVAEQIRSSDPTTRQLPNLSTTSASCWRQPIVSKKPSR
jgi:arylsulfatase A-like enzyme